MKRSEMHGDMLQCSHQLVHCEHFAANFANASSSRNIIVQFAEGFSVIASNVPALIPLMMAMMGPVLCLCVIDVKYVKGAQSR